MSSNPYQTPEGQLTTDDQAFGEIKFFSPASRINRLRYWAHSMVLFIGFFLCLAAAGFILELTSELVGGILGIIIFIIYLMCCFIVAIQRLHDLNKSGWMALLVFIPLANIYLAILLIFFEGTNGRNNYGLKPPTNKAWHWVLALTMPVLMVLLGVLVAITVPIYQSIFDQSQNTELPYEVQDADAYSSEDTEEAASDDNLFSDEAIEDGISYEVKEKEIIEDDVVEGEVSEEEVIDAIEEASDELESSEMQSDTPQ